ncbi:MAG: amidohydrolase [Comamonadaceae bacterium]|nr:MAG: amidohydrolase [Comamonadaceae bacterium]
MSEGSNLEMTENPFPPIRPDWLALQVEPVIDPDYPIVDAHHHLFDVPLWRYRFEDYLADIGSGHNVIATVYAECGSMYKASGPKAFRPIGETEFVNGVAAMSASGGFGKTQVCSAIFGHVDLTLGAQATEVLQAHIQAGGGRFRGIRHATVYDASPAVRTTLDLPPPHLMADPKFREGFACLAPLGLSFDVWMYHPQLSDLISLARAFPETTIVLDHVAGVLGIGPYAGRRDEIFGTWTRDMRELARLPNVQVKVGGLGMHSVGFGFHERPRPPSSEELAQAWRPYVETTIELFGAQRCMFESNFPVDKVSCSYAVLWNALKRLSAHASPDEKAALMHGTATRVYRLALEEKELSS